MGIRRRIIWMHEKVSSHGQFSWGSMPSCLLQSLNIFFNKTFFSSATFISWIGFFLLMQCKWWQDMGNWLRVVHRTTSVYGLSRELLSCKMLKVRMGMLFWFFLNWKFLHMMFGTCKCVSFFVNVMGNISYSRKDIQSVIEDRNSWRLLAKGLNC